MPTDPPTRLTNNTPENEWALYHLTVKKILYGKSNQIWYANCIYNRNNDPAVNSGSQFRRISGRRMETKSYLQGKLAVDQTNADGSGKLLDQYN